MQVIQIQQINPNEHLRKMQMLTSRCVTAEPTNVLIENIKIVVTGSKSLMTQIPNLVQVLVIAI